MDEGLTHSLATVWERACYYLPSVGFLALVVCWDASLQPCRDGSLDFPLYICLPLLAWMVVGPQYFLSHLAGLECHCLKVFFSCQIAPFLVLWQKEQTSCLIFIYFIYLFSLQLSYVIFDSRSRVYEVKKTHEIHHCVILHEVPCSWSTFSPHFSHFIKCSFFI